MRISLKVFLLAIAATACDSSTGSKKAPDQAPGGGSTTPQANLSTPAIEVDPALIADLRLQHDLTVSKASFLRPIGNDLAIRAAKFREASESLQENIRLFCEDLSPLARASAQDSWKSAISEWQHFEVFQLGPIIDNKKALKYSIYAWPETAGYCKIEDEALKALNDNNYTLPAFYNRRGLQAIEFLLFEDKLASFCTADDPNASRWNQLSVNHKWQARCAYLKPLAADLVQQSHTLVDQWGTVDDNYISRQLGDASSEDRLVQALYEAFFFIDLELKNQKIAAPAGQDLRYCLTSPNPCPEREEHRFADFSRQAINLNIKAFLDLIYGPAMEERAGGFAALIRAQGRNDVADRSERMADELAQLTVEEGSSSMKDLLLKHNQENCEVSANSWLCLTIVKIKGLAAELKREYSQILSLSLPEAASGDND